MKPLKTTLKAQIFAEFIFAILVLNRENLFHKIWFFLVQRLKKIRYFFTKQFSTKCVDTAPFFSSFLLLNLSSFSISFCHLIAFINNIAKLPYYILCLRVTIRKAFGETIVTFGNLYFRRYSFTMNIFWSAVSSVLISLCACLFS